MENLTVNIKEILQMKNLITVINSYPLSNIDWVDENDEIVKIDKNIIQEFLYTGLSNIDFISTGFYKDGFK